MKPSAKTFRKIGKRLKGYSFLDWIHGHVYLRWPYFYIGVATGEHPLTRVFTPLYKGIMRLRPAHKSRDSARAMADSYHGKVMPLEDAARLVQVNQSIQVEDLEQVIPYAQARAIILENPDRIVALTCPCRSVRDNPCLPLDVCLIIGEPFASFAAEYHPSKSRWISQDEAAQILREEHERGHVHHAFFKDAMLGRYYAICNCCSCCCGAMQAHDHGVPMLASSGYVAEADLSRCTGCGLCAEACPFDALSLSDSTLVIDTGRCMGCGVCVSRCKQNALRLKREPARGTPLQVENLTQA